MNGKEILEELLERYPCLAVCRGEIERAYSLLVECFRADRTLFLCGNGGSAADADHIVGELGKGFCRRRPISEKEQEFYRRDERSAFLAEQLQCGWKAVNLMGHSALGSAAANDLDPRLGPAQQLNAFGRMGDLLLGISTSGNAQNLFFACKVAHARGMTVIGLTGASGGLLKTEADVCICVPEKETYKVQELHLPVYHALCRMVEDTFFAK